jgi:hypothetical protein
MTVGPQAKRCLNGGETLIDDGRQLMGAAA